MERTAIAFLSANGYLRRLALVGHWELSLHQLCDAGRQRLQSLCGGRRNASVRTNFPSRRNNAAGFG
jgi:hypothetical protein